MEDYIVRIYRRKDESGELFGMLEDVGVDRKQPFRSMAELVRLLEGGKLGDRRRAVRIRLAIPATVEGRDSSGAPFSESVVISALTAHGAKLRLSARVMEGDVLRIAPDAPGNEPSMDATVARAAEVAEHRTIEVVFGATEFGRGTPSGE